MTNADFVRNMTDEELYAFICENTTCQICGFFTYGGCDLNRWLAAANDKEDIEEVENTMTNADKIRSMTDEELSEFICHNSNCQTCQFMTFGGCTLEEWLGKEHEDHD